MDAMRRDRRLLGIAETIGKIGEDAEQSKAAGHAVLRGLIAEAEARVQVRLRSSISPTGNPPPAMNPRAPKAMRLSVPMEAWPP